MRDGEGILNKSDGKSFYVFYKLIQVLWRDLALPSEINQVLSVHGVELVSDGT